MTLETWQLGSGDDVGDSAAGDWRQCGDLADVECR